MSGGAFAGSDGCDSFSFMRSNTGHWFDTRRRTPQLAVLR